MVFGAFFLHMGLVQNGIVEKFSIAYFVIFAPFIYVQLKIFAVLMRLNKKMFSQE